MWKLQAFNMNAIWQLGNKLAQKLRTHNWNKRYNYFLSEGYLHGVRYFGERSKIWGKIYWIIILIASFIGLIIILQLTYEGYHDNIIQINMDTAHLHWNNTFPAVSVCLKESSSDLAARDIVDFIETYWMAHNITLEAPNFYFFLYLMTYVYITPTTPKIIELEECYYNLNETCGVDVNTIKQLKFPKKCSAFMNVTYMGKIYENCEDIFKLQETEMGRCFTANGLFADEFDLSQLPLKFAFSDNDRILEMELNYNLFSYDIYVHSPEESPNKFSEYTFTPESMNFRYNYLFNAIETVNENDVQYVSIENRNCRFPNEKLQDMVEPYSFLSCLTTLRIETEIEICNCTIHCSPIQYQNKYCNYEQTIKCIQEANITERTLEKLYETKSIPCVQSCIEMEIDFIGFTAENLSPSAHKSYDYILENIEDEYEYNENLSSLEMPSNETMFYGIAPNGPAPLLAVGSMRMDFTPISSESTTVCIQIQNTPTIRYQRTVAQTQLDLIVAIGGTVGLFFGASILGMVQLIYIWLIREF